MPNEIASIRAELGLTWSELAAALGVARTTAMQWDKGEWTPNETALRLARALLDEKRRAGQQQGAA